MAVTHRFIPMSQFHQTIAARGTTRLPATRGSLATQYQTAQSQAKATNLARYKEILAEYQERYAGVMGSLEGAGAQERADIEARGRSMQSGALQDAIGRGLAGTTVLPSMRAGYAKQTEGELGRQSERLQQQRTGLMAGLSGDTLGFMERREDEYPDMNQMMQLMQQYGYGQGAGGGYGQQRMSIMDRMMQARLRARQAMGR